MSSQNQNFDVGNQRNISKREANTRRREVYRYETSSLVNGIAWSNKPNDNQSCLLLGLSTIYDGINKANNRVEIVHLRSEGYDEVIETLAITKDLYPVTRILWAPLILAQSSESNLIAINSDKLTIWASNHDLNCGQSSGDLNLRCTLHNNAPTTSFDWNESDPSIIITASVDTTCTLWDIEVNKLTNTLAKANTTNQIVAHDHEIYDVSFTRLGSGREVFVSVGGDGCLRLFDTRQLSQSSILYETEKITPTTRQSLVRVECNKVDPYQVATIALDSSDITLIDVRKPRRPLCKLSNHRSQVNSLSWAPHSAHLLCSASSDQCALIWDLARLQNHVVEPILAYKARGEINAISWCQDNPSWISVGYKNCMELLRV